MIVQKSRDQEVKLSNGMHFEVCVQCVYSVGMT